MFTFLLCNGFPGGSSAKYFMGFTHWGRVTHICVANLTIIGSDNGLSPGWRQAIIWTNAWILSSGPLETNFREISIKIQTFSFMKMVLKVSSAKWQPYCLGLNVLTWHWQQCNRVWRQLISLFYEGKINSSVHQTSVHKGHFLVPCVHYHTWAL